MDADRIEIVTPILAVLGAVLGVMNAWRNWVHDRVKIEVSVKSATAFDGAEGMVVTVLNLSRFPVTITRLGFDRISGRHAQIVIPRFTHGEALPVRLESRTVCTAVVSVVEMPPEDLDVFVTAFAETACGVRIKGGRKYFAVDWPALAVK